MHARSTTFDGMPDRTYSGMQLVMDEVRPTLEQSPGCIGMSCLVDSASGQVIVTSSWESHPAMRASHEGLMDLRARVNQSLGGTMHIDEWSIALMHHGQHGTVARVGWVRGDIDRIVTTFREMSLPAMEQYEGFCGASVLTDGANGMCCITTTFTDMPALIKSRDIAQQVREIAMADAGAKVMRVMEYELPYAHLNVPELV